MGKVSEMKRIRFDWEAMAFGGFECEVAQGDVCYSLAVECLQSSPWEQAVWMIHTPQGGSGARRVAADLASTIDEAKASAEEACRRLFAGTLERVK